MLRATDVASGEAWEACRDEEVLSCREWREWSVMEEDSEDGRLQGRLDVAVVCDLGLELGNVVREAARLHASGTELADTELDDRQDAPADLTAARCMQDANRGSNMRAMLECISMPKWMLWKVCGKPCTAKDTAVSGAVDV